MRARHVFYLLNYVPKKDPSHKRRSDSTTIVGGTTRKVYFLRFTTPIFCLFVWFFLPQCGDTLLLRKSFLWCFSCFSFFYLPLISLFSESFQCGRRSCLGVGLGLGLGVNVSVFLLFGVFCLFLSFFYKKKKEKDKKHHKKKREKDRKKRKTPGLPPTYQEYKEQQKEIRFSLWRGQNPLFLSVAGFEPAAIRLKARCSTDWAIHPTPTTFQGLFLPLSGPFLDLGVVSVFGVFIVFYLVFFFMFVFLGIKKH